jgi:hypothetical protein
VWVKHDRKYKAILLGALIMSTGAKIKDNDIQYLRQLAPEVKSNENFALPLFDSGFRSPGKRQFLAALDNYKPGTVRNFHEPSCHACGKTNQDMEKPLLRCSGCMTAWFCNKVGAPAFVSLITGLTRSSAGLPTQPLESSQAQLWRPEEKSRRL